MKRIILPILLISSSGFASVIFSNGDNNQVQFSLYQGLVSSGTYTTSYTNGAYCDGVTCFLPNKNSSITLDMINDSYNFSAISFMYNLSQVDGYRYPFGDFSDLNPAYSVLYNDNTKVDCAPGLNLYLNVHDQASPEASCQASELQLIMMILKVIWSCTSLLQQQTI